MKRIKLGIVIAALSVLLVGCGESEPAKVGSLMDFTGELGEFGGPMNDAILLAADHINAAGGVLDGRQIEIISEDGATSDVTSVDAARKLVECGRRLCVGRSACQRYHAGRGERRHRSQPGPGDILVGDLTCG